MSGFIQFSDIKNELEIHVNNIFNNYFFFKRETCLPESFNLFHNL